jgi:hypothetical protein
MASTRGLALRTEPSRIDHMLSSADCTITTSESEFLVHTDVP